MTDFTNRYFDGFGFVTQNVNFDLHGGLNSLTVDETAGGETSFALYPARLTYSELFAPSTADFHFTNISGGVTISGSSSVNHMQVFGTGPTSPGFQHTILMNGGNDQIVLYPHDLAGQLTINGNLGVGGGTESDTLTVDDSGSGLPISYSFFNQFGPSTTNIGGTWRGRPRRGQRCREHHGYRRRRRRYV